MTGYLWKALKTGSTVALFATVTACAGISAQQESPFDQGIYYHQSAATNNGTSAIHVLSEGELHFR